MIFAVLFSFSTAFSAIWVDIEFEQQSNKKKSEVLTAEIDRPLVRFLKARDHA